MKLLLLIAALSLSLGCANQKAGEILALAQSEALLYQRNANAKVQQAEDARLELELRLVEIDLRRLFDAQDLPVEQRSSATVHMVMQKVREYQARLAEWQGADHSASLVNMALASVNKYHQEGVRAEDLIPAIENIPNILRSETSYARFAN